jgi:hypothetical protein
MAPTPETKRRAFGDWSILWLRVQGLPVLHIIRWHRRLITANY